MICNVQILAGGGWAMICGPQRVPGKCAGCDAPSTLLCDGPGRNGRRTCDAPICRACAKAIGKNRDLCPGCADPVEALVAMFHARAEEWERTMGTEPVRIVSAVPRPMKSEGPSPLVYRIHVAQLDASCLAALTNHIAAKYGHPPKLLHMAFTQGQLHPAVEAELLEVRKVAR
jgi:hypothetical protein